MREVNGSFVLQKVKLPDEREIDVVIRNGIVAEIVPGGKAKGEGGFDGTGLYVSPGWIDLHVHAFPEFEPYGDEIDEIGVKQGVTTIVDAGSCGADRIAELRKSAKGARTGVFAFLNVSHIGLARVDELSRLAWIDEEKAAAAVRENGDFIVGLKARMSGSVVKDNGIEPLRLARRISGRTGLPLMVHIGSAPPAIEDILALLQERDIVTHYLNGKPNNLFRPDGTPVEGLADAIRRGVHLDVGHGTASFSFRAAEQARRCSIGLGTISTDIYRGNRLEGPVYGMANVMSKFLSLGYSLREVVDAVTVRAAAWLNKPELGRIRVGDKANLTLFEVKKGKRVLVDSEGERRLAEAYVEAKGVVIGGSYYTC
nr:amidohydrolase/deacetylase family metallohydrolase [Cohnella algarum]